MGDAEGGTAAEPEDVYGDFEDLEANADADASDASDDATRLQRKKAALKRQFDQTYDKDDDASPADPDAATFYDAAKADLDAQAARHDTEFAQDDDGLRAAVQGYRAGTYVRLVMEGVPCEFIEHFDAASPVLVGGLLANEDQFGFCQVGSFVPRDDGCFRAELTVAPQARIKKHRWFPKILKTNDPLIISMGWRRFQTLPIYSLNDATRNRMLKYTPEHMHCHVTFYGPMTPPNTGFCAFQTLTAAQPHFRVSATGVMTELDKTVQIVKKLKLTGYPHKVHQKTAFIKDMFTSALEVAKFEGASLRTVSGIRGQIKKPMKVGALGLVCVCGRRLDRAPSLICFRSRRLRVVFALRLRIKY